MASQVNEDTSWLQRLFPFWKHEIYITDPPGTNSSLISVKGLESMVYLTYIIDNYEVLPDVVIFTHGGRYRWHHDDPLYDNARVLSRLQIPYVQEQGYVNLRCVWTVGCPAEIHTNRKGGDEDLANGGPLPGAIYAAAFHDLFPGRDLPSRVGTSCCANFAAAKSAIVARPRQDYERYRRWLVDTDLDSSAGAKVLEYSLHRQLSSERRPLFAPLQGSATVRSLECATSHWKVQAHLKRCKVFQNLRRYQMDGPGWVGTINGRTLPPLVIFLVRNSLTHYRLPFGRLHVDGGTWMERYFLIEYRIQAAVSSGTSKINVPLTQVLQQL
ncbi:hypothetical protein E4T47_07004 [Aureobasidium subglaciale]|nr:hypothetical protein E4T47_07004 [Aureobasidium subglaciale]